MIFDNNLLAYEYYKNQYVPKEVYTSGEKDETKLIDKYSVDKKNAPVIALKDDIVNHEGYGLKNGFYSVVPDRYLDFLLLYQGADLKAKVPVVAFEVYESVNAKTPKTEKMSYRRYLKQQEKQYRKYLKGINPEEFDFKEANIEYDREKDAYIIFYNSNNYSLVGVIKF